MNWNALGDVTILMAEDDMFNRLLIVSLLSKYSNVEVIEAQNGVEALDVLQKKKIDILLLDIYMPKMNGFEVMERAQEDSTLSNIPIMVLSSDEVEKKKSLQMGVNAFIPKPFNLQELEVQIYEVLASCRV